MFDGDEARRLHGGAHGGVFEVAASVEAEPRSRERALRGCNVSLPKMVIGEVVVWIQGCCQTTPFHPWPLVSTITTTRVRHSEGYRSE